MLGDDQLLAGVTIAGGNHCSRKSRPGSKSAAVLWLCRIAASLAIGTTTLCKPFGFAHAQQVYGVGLLADTVEVIQLAVFVGIIGGAMLSTVALIRERARLAADNSDLRSRVTDLNASIQRTDTLLNLRDQRAIIWTTDNKQPELIGAMSVASGAPDDHTTFLSFGCWLMPRSAAALENAIAGLRNQGTAFELVTETHTGSVIEVQGRKSGTHVIVHFISISEAQHLQARLKRENQRIGAEYETLIVLLDVIDTPFWMRDGDGHLQWVNKAYVQAVKAVDGQAVVREGMEFLGTKSREEIAKQHQSCPVFQQQLSTVIDGDRKMFAVTDILGRNCSAGIAIDMSATDTIRAEYGQVVRSHADTLDQVATAIVTFDANQKLRFYNQAFQKIWDLDADYLTSEPDNALLLDRLRSERKLPEQPDWRCWKENLLDAYHAVDQCEHLWHLPDGRTIRVVANPQPKGGVTWVFENLTEKIDLENRYTTAVRVQGETLDNLAEGVVVFGPDGRVRLFNPSFGQLWGVSDDILSRNTHISVIRAECDMHAKISPWSDFVAAVTGFDERSDHRGQTELRNGIVLQHTIVHLPNGHVMLTFVDVTDSVNIARALKDKNEALQRADQIKNEFVQHISYELRSPLTNIIGFTELLLLPVTGPLSQRQHEYVEHVRSSSGVLLTIVNDILDLATVDAGIMQLDLSDVNVDSAIADAAALVVARLQEHSIRLAVDISAAPKSFRGDETRVRQILYNLLSNSINYAPSSSTITLACRRRSEGIEFSVHDDGHGMPPEVLDVVFQRFSSCVNGGRHRGAGLGLSIVKSFVELHGGTVCIDSGKNCGTTVVCLFPDTLAEIRVAAE